MAQLIQSKKSPESKGPLRCALRCTLHSASAKASNLPAHGCAFVQDNKWWDGLKVYKKMLQESNISSTSITNPTLMSNKVRSTGH